MSDKRMTTTEVARYLGISEAMFTKFRLMTGFPLQAAERRGASLLWDIKPILVWLNDRAERQNRGKPPRWRRKVARAVARMGEAVAA